MTLLKCFKEIYIFIFIEIKWKKNQKKYIKLIIHKLFNKKKTKQIKCINSIEKLITKKRREKSTIKKIFEYRMHIYFHNKYIFVFAGIFAYFHTAIFCEKLQFINNQSILKFSGRFQCTQNLWKKKQQQTVVISLWWRGLNEFEMLSFH